MRNLRAAITFLTRIPIPTAGATTLSAAVPWFPIVGGMIGLLVGLVAVGMLTLVPALVAASVAVVFGVLLTGAFHEDGLADVADAFAGGWTREQRLRILDDPLHGSYGVAALCGSIVVRVACVASLGFSRSTVLAVLIVAHMLARAGAVALMMAVPVARAEGLGVDYAATLPRRNAAIGIGVGVALAFVATGWWAFPLIASVALAAVVVGWLSVRKIGGVSGDVLGAAEQVGECFVLITATGLAARYGLWWR